MPCSVFAAGPVSEPPPFGAGDREVGDLRDPRRVLVDRARAARVVDVDRTAAEARRGMRPLRELLLAREADGAAA